MKFAHTYTKAATQHSHKAATQYKYIKILLKDVRNYKEYSTHKMG
jgi:hypothetical protein